MSTIDSDFMPSIFGHWIGIRGRHAGFDGRHTGSLVGIVRNPSELASIKGESDAG
jgi:hypothetical protein